MPSTHTLYQKLQKKLVALLNGGNEDAFMSIKLVMAGRFMTAIAVPFVGTVLLANDCQGFWLQLWTTGCTNNPHSYDLSIGIPIPGGVSMTSVLSHGDICSPKFKVAGRCPRAVADILGTLIFRKLMVSAFLGSVLAVVKTLPLWSYVVGLCKQDYQYSKSIDREVGGIVMLLEYGLLLGFIYPTLLPFSCIALYLHAAAFHFAAKRGVLLKNDTKPSTVYLWASLLLGMGFIMWFYGSCNLGGKWVVYIGIPVSVVATTWWAQNSRLLGAGTTTHHELTILMEQLRDPLLPEDADACESHA